MISNQFIMLRPIRTEEDYDNVLGRIYYLMQQNIQSESQDADELEVLSILVKDYEDKHYPVPLPHPIEAIKFRIEQMGMSEGELSKILGHRSRKHDLFSGRRKLSLGMIRTLHEALNIPAETLIKSY